MPVRIPLMLLSFCHTRKKSTVRTPPPVDVAGGGGHCCRGCSVAFYCLFAHMVVHMVSVRKRIRVIGI